MNISPSFVKSNVAIIAPVLLNQFNAILKTGNLPDAWKECFLIPIPKKGVPSDVNNYRGIAIESCVPKLFDKMLAEKLRYHVTPIITLSQHGFMPGRSTLTNLMEHTIRILEAISQKLQVDTIYVDMAKAFDTMSHRVLAAKLAKLSMPFAPFKTVMKFVVKRKYILKIDNIITEFIIMPDCSVPQGSHSGPLLYILFVVNDALASTQLATLDMFADDTKISRIIRTRQDTIDLQMAYNQFNVWARTNKLTINKSKTVTTSYFANQRIPAQYYHELDPLKYQQNIKDLGVLFDQKTTFKPHIESVVAKCKKMNAIMGRFVRQTGTNKMAVYILHRRSSIAVRCSNLPSTKKRT